MGISSFFQALGQGTVIFIAELKACGATATYQKEYPDSHVFMVEMPGLESEDMMVQLQNGHELFIRGWGVLETEKEGAKYVSLDETRFLKLWTRFLLMEDTKTDAISAVCKGGVLTVTVKKLSPHEKPKKPCREFGMIKVRKG